MYGSRWFIDDQFDRFHEALELSKTWFSYWIRLKDRNEICSYVWVEYFYLGYLYRSNEGKVVSLAFAAQDIGWVVLQLHDYSIVEKL